MNQIILLGDSIFDNAAYVEAGESVKDQLSHLLAKQQELRLLAVDGHVTSDVFAQLDNLTHEASHLFLSIGGNDALTAVSVLRQEVKSVSQALDVMAQIRDQFRGTYASLLEALIARQKCLAVCTIYNTIPAVGEAALTALALFNEVILQEAVSRGLCVLDLRVCCNELQDYSQTFPIEPSGHGAAKIASLIHRVMQEHDFSLGQTKIYV